MTETPPSDRVLLHVGVHKTGSTALQAAFAEARPELIEKGILYPGDSDLHHGAAVGVAAAGNAPGDRSDWTRIRAWQRSRKWRLLSSQVRRHDGRAIVSSEFFGRLGPRGINRAVAGLGGARIHVLLGVRPLVEILPSSWQQYLKSGLTTDYEDWLRQMLLPGSGKDPARSRFWARANFAQIIRRWTSVVPPENITAVVLDPQDRDLMARTAEELIGLPMGVLTRHAGRGTNRSMTAVEAELLRQINIHVDGSMDHRTYTEQIRNGVVRTIVEERQPPESEPVIATPQWAVDVALQRQKRDLRRLRNSGVELRGPWDRLRDPSLGAEPLTVTELPIDLAALGVSIAVGWRP